MVNDYDKFAAQIQNDLLTGQKPPHRFVEKPAMKSLLPSLSNKKVLLIGCGTGEEVLLLEEFGAANTTGTDLSKESIRLASEAYPNHTFIAADMHELPFDDATFDFVYSSLAIHYSAEPARVYKEISRVLKPNGTLQFSIVHPVRWASSREIINGVPTKLMGYTEGDEPIRLYGNYSEFHQVSEVLSGNGELQFWVGPPSMHFGLLREAGFTVTDFIETKAVPETREFNRNYYERFSHFPQFVVFVAKKPELQLN